MAVPSTLSDLSTTAASNSPSGSESIGTSLDDYLRAIQAIIKHGVSKGSDIASAGTITPVATSSYFVVTGTTTITAIGETNSWVGRTIVLKFSGALILTHAAALILPGAANITTVAGDVLAFVNESAGVWRCVFYQPSAGYPVFGGALGTPSSGNLTNCTIPQSALTGLTTADSPQFAGVNVGHASDTTITRASAGVIAVEGSNVLLTSGLGVTVQAYDVDTAKTDVVQTFSAAQRGGVTALTSSAASIAINLATTNNFSHTMTENTTLAAPSNPVAGQSGVITITQHASAPKTLAYNSFWKFTGGVAPSLTATNSAVDVFTYYVNSGSFATCQLIKGVA